MTFKIIMTGYGRTLPTHFDPLVLRAFLDTHLEFARIFEEIVD